MDKSSDEELTPFLEWTIENVRNSEYKVEYKTEYKTHYKTELVVKLVLHITLISIFETLFYFLYISSLENSGIEWTIDAFINKAVNGCENMTPSQLQKLDDILKKYINSSSIISLGNTEESSRMLYNTVITYRALIYIGGLSGLFALIAVYIKYQRIKINWLYIILENTSMVTLLGLYELIFFNTIIYPYQPISTDEIERNMVERLHTSCGLL